MGYTKLTNQAGRREYTKFGLEDAALAFIRESCEGLRFDPEKEKEEKSGIYLGTSLHENEIPYNMQMDIDRLCLENVVRRFLDTGRKEDAFDVYFCYLEMFVGDYEKTRRMIELLSEFEANGSGLLMKHRDHYSHSVYVFILGLAIYQSNGKFKSAYKEFYEKAHEEGYDFSDEHQIAHHFLKYWGLASLFHDIGYPFELPFEQVASYFEVAGDKREKRPFVSYNGLEAFVKFNKSMQRKIGELYGLCTDKMICTTDELFAYALYQKLGEKYYFSEAEMLKYLQKKPTEPNAFGHFMDHAYFSAAVLFKKLFEELGLKLTKEHIDSLTAIILHNSLYKFSVAFYKDPVSNKRLKAEWHPLAFMLMLCDELQCWDRTAYGRNSRKELHPMGCRFEFSDDTIKAVYLYDDKESAKIKNYEELYRKWQSAEESNKPKLKAYSAMYEKNDKGVSDFQEDIERIVDLSEIKLAVEVEQTKCVHAKNYSYLSSCNFIHLYSFAIVLNGRWDCYEEWEAARKAGREDDFISKPQNRKRFAESFKKLSLEYKLSNLNQAKAFARYMEEIGCFYTDKSVDFDMVEQFTADDLVKIGVLEHQRWLQEHYDMGWEYGTPEKEQRELVRQHKDMIPDSDLEQLEVSLEQAERNYKRLNKAEQDKDTAPMDCMLAMLRMFDGLRIYRLR